MASCLVILRVLMSIICVLREDVALLLLLLLLHWVEVALVPVGMWEFFVVSIAVAWAIRNWNLFLVIQVTRMAVGVIHYWRRCLHMLALPQLWPWCKSLWTESFTCSLSIAQLVNPSLISTWCMDWNFILRAWWLELIHNGVALVANVIIIRVEDLLLILAVLVARELMWRALVTRVGSKHLVVDCTW